VEKENGRCPSTQLSLSDVTRILEAMERGEGQAAEQLLPLVYAELRPLAAHKMAKEIANQTMQVAALVESSIAVAGGLWYSRLR